MFCLIVIAISASLIRWVFTGYFSQLIAYCIIGYALIYGANEIIVFCLHRIARYKEEVHLHDRVNQSLLQFSELEAHFSAKIAALILCGHVYYYADTSREWK